MSAQRQISRLDFRSAFQADRLQVPAGFLGARGRVEGLVRFGKISLLTATGGFNRAGIMAAAVFAARAHQERHGGSWSDAMSVSLRAAWQTASKARRSAAH